MSPISCSRMSSLLWHRLLISTHTHNTAKPFSSARPWAHRWDFSPGRCTPQQCFSAVRSQWLSSVLNHIDKPNLSHLWGRTMGIWKGESYWRVIRFFHTCWRSVWMRVAQSSLGSSLRYLRWKIQNTKPDSWKDQKRWKRKKSPLRPGQNRLWTRCTLTLIP